MRCARLLGPTAIAVVIACRGGAASAPGMAELVDHAARTCAKVASCAHAHDAPRDHDPGSCVDAWVSRAPADLEPFETCVDSARGCKQVDACMRARGDAVATAYCRDNPGARSGCDGTRLVTCTEDDPLESSSTDCAAFGATCGDCPQSGGLLTRACLSSTLCPPGAPDVRCDSANAIVGCRDGAVDRTPCPGGARCEEHLAADGTSSAFCESPGDRHCSVVGKRWCEQGKLMTCLPHGPWGQVAVADCSALGLACDERSEAGPSCVIPGHPACEHAAPRCESDALTFCAAGRLFRVACSDLGFGACDPDAYGVDAACAPAGPAR